MSWSVAAIGKAPAVRKEIARQFEQGGKCAEPEETIRQSTAKLIDDALAGTHEGTAVQVQASGSQGYENWSDKTGVSNNLVIQIAPQHQFVE